MTSLIQDLRYALRILAKSPGFSAIAIGTLALGIGANAAIFALVDRVLLRLLPVRNPEELVILRSEGDIQGHGWSDMDIAMSFTYPMYRDLRDGSDVFAGLLAQYPFEASVAAQGQTERAQADLMSGNAFDVLGVVPALGRVLTSEDDRAPGASPVAVLSHGYWTRRFASDPSILNKTIVVNGQPLTVVGVSREGFTGIQPGRRTDLFVPMMEKAQMTAFWNGLDDPKDYWVQVVGRLKPGLSRAQAEARIAPLYRSLLENASASLSGWQAKDLEGFKAKKLELTPGGTGRGVLRSGIGKPLLSVMAMVALVLLIACSNLAGLLAARGAARQREYGIRLAIGASRAQLLRQSVVEALVFSLAGGALGVAVATWTLDALLKSFPPDADLRTLAVQIDPRVLAFAAALSLLSALFFGLAPTLRAARLDPASTLGGAGRGSSSAGRDALRFRQWLVTAQVAFTLVLLVAAGLFVRTLENLGRVDLGLKPDGVLGFSVQPDSNGYTAERTALFGRQLQEALASLPAVRSAAAAELPTLANDTSGGNVTIEGSQANPDALHVNYNHIGPDYFSTLGIPLMAGREISWQDDARAPRVAIVNETFVKKLLAGRNPLGVRFGRGAGKTVKTDIEIVGVVKDSKNATVDEKPAPFVYFAWQQDAKLGQLTFYVRSERDPGALVSAIREDVRRLDPQLPVFDVKSLPTQISESLVSRKLVTILSAAFGVLAAALAALGIYGVLAFGVAQRRREIGVRIALGATPGNLRRLVLSEVGRFLLFGALLGLPAAYALARAVQSILFDVPAADPPVFAAGLALLAAVALEAGYPPARRAARTNAVDALRSE